MPAAFSNLGRLFLPVFLLFSACGPSHFIAPVDGPTTAVDLMARSAVKRASLRSIVGEARVEYYGEQGVRKGDMYIVAEKPARVRFEALSPTGDTLAVLVSDGSLFTSFQRGQRECHVGPACPRNVGRLLPIALPPEAIVDVLFGQAPIIKHKAEQLAFDSSTGRYVLTLEDPDNHTQQRVAYDAHDLVVRKVEVRRAGRLVFRIAYDDFRKFGETRVPRRLSFRMPQGDIDLSLSYRDWEANPKDIDPGSFQFECPEGTRRITLPCDDPPLPRGESSSDDR